MADTKRREKFIEDMLRANPTYDIDLLERAYDKAEEVHEGQYRKSGEDYIIHPIEVARILADLGMDEQTIAAGLLHDTVEDTPYTLEDVKNDFGEEVAVLVDGVTKLNLLVFDSKETQQAENVRKMFLAMSKDIRVLIIKLADRLHNLRTINYMNEDKIREKCRETLEIYSPLAARLGMYNVRMELEDIALKHLEPQAYQKLVEDVNRRRGEGQPFLDHVIATIREALDKAGINAEIKGRFKHYYSVYRKMKIQKRSLDEIFDLVACRIIVDTVKDCYGALGIVHTLWTPIPGRFKDYIAMPKSNLYQSIHTTVMGDNGNPFEIQIRTHEMNRVAEYGIAAHWKYKEGIAQDPEEFKLAWLRQTLEWQKDLNDSKEFLDTLKVDLFSSQVFVFTPKGDVMELPKGSTPLDFAFKIHSDVGAKCVGAKVNGKMVPIDYELQNGEIISIVTSNNSKGPSIDWLKIAKTNTAKAKIRQYLKKMDRGESVEKGKEMLEKYIRRKGYDPQDVIRAAWINKAAKNFGQPTAESLYNNISYGGVMLSKVAVYLVDLYHEDKQAELKAREQREAEITAAVESRK
ncbi:MAG: bifunctional (p)ppGpp synthetase/guanosine-3',5'-bis(diphosphate) 3'-pyrophosphohydrolase, partial [Firmicutes bacterium]|nr:bifunctional (p)ppGpp synthetase/guanosine-3',5'-bis(diphosphate) 3'-pyrophosphohydrolase [Bacillota bacterium]